MKWPSASSNSPQPDPRPRGAAAITVRAALREGALLLKAASVDDPLLTARLLLAHALQVDQTALVRHGNDPVKPSLLRSYRALLRRRADHEPVQYILGHAAFLDFDVKVDPRVLIPRPETELLAEAAIARLRSLPAASTMAAPSVSAPVPPTSGRLQTTRTAGIPAREPADNIQGQAPDLRHPRNAVCDVGAGSGVIAIAIARAIPAAHVFATDVSQSALDLASENAARCGVGGHISFLCGDLLQPIRARAVQVDMICSNPPYISPAEFGKLATEISAHEPRAALFADEDGALFYRRIIAEAPGVLVPGGWLLMELGAGLSERVSILAHESGMFDLCEIIKDCAGIDRVVVLRRREWVNERRSGNTGDRGRGAIARRSERQRGEKRRPSHDGGIHPGG
jgi:release factor glutamine methyltransferase